MTTVQTSPDVQMRPLDKDFEWLEPYDILFEQYINTRLFDLGDGTLEQSGVGDFSKYSNPPKSSSGSDRSCHSPGIEAEGKPTECGQPCGKALSCLEQTSALPTAGNQRRSCYSDSHSKANVSGSLYSLGQSNSAQIRTVIAVSSPSDFPFPNADNQVPDTPTLFNATHQPISTSTSKLVRKASTSPNMMRGSNYRSTCNEVWAQRIEASKDKYNLHLPGSSGPLSPPPSATVEQEEHKPVYGHVLNDMSQGFEDTLSPLSTQFGNLSHMTPLASPPVDHPNGQRNSYFGPAALAQYHEHSNFAVQPMHNLMTPPQTQHLTMSAWPPAQKPYDFPVPSPDITDWPTENIAHAGDNTARDSVHYASDVMSDLTNDAAFGGTSNTSAASGTELATNGLLIDMHGISSSGKLHVADGSREGSGSSAIGYSSALSPPELKMGDPSCSQVYPPPPVIPASASPVNLTTAPAPGRPRRQHSSPENSPTSSLSYPHTRRGSAKSQTAHAARPPPSHPSQSQQKAHRRSKSTSTRAHYSPTRAHRRHHRAQSSSMPASGGAATGGFVNFTPEDSRKILTGVAPSGSSKTKARREKEAAEKRRKLSEAAVKAIEEAGGDVTVLDGVVLE
ncbi:MAG: hypothetical protein M1822_000409 [Bathelium mastoideum]|nr:MAG: hypothetical protein M1822_000409 [Bathelium mastoideum]